MEKLDANLLWEEVEEMVSLALLRQKKADIKSFALDRGLILGLSWEESRWLDAHGFCMVWPGTLVFHKWSPILGSKDDSRWCKEVWIRIRGLPFHLWKKDVFSSIVEKCGGLSKIDDNTISLTDLRWARNLTVKMDLRLIPRAVKVSDGELCYQVAICSGR